MKPLPWRWVTYVRPVFTGAEAYIHLVRAPDDPERKKWERGERDLAAEWLRNLNRSEPSFWQPKLLALLQDGAARTFNRIGVELIDKTADVLFGTPVETALWDLLERGAIEMRNHTPILFRRVA